VTADQFPWAIDIPVATAHMIEKNDIVTGHLKFAQWAQSGGTIFQDWYLPNLGYRDNSNLYPNP
jgi:LruC domain-containing protein